MAKMTVDNLTFGYDGSIDNVFENVSLQIDTNWKLGFIGRNGRGKTTFLKLLMKEYEYRGTIHSGGMQFDYFPTDPGNLQQNTIDILHQKAPDAMEWQMIKELALLDISEEVLYRPFASLSNGERTKALLAGLFIKENNFLLIDEPTNHLDLYGRKKVAEYLKKSSKGFILVSHDRTFLDGCVDHILSINRNGIEVQRGNYSSWQQNKEWQDKNELEENEKLKKELKRLSAAAEKTCQWSDALEKTKKQGRKKGGCGIKPDKGHIGHKAAKMMQRSKNIEFRRESAFVEKQKFLKNLEKADDLKIHTLECPKQVLVAVRDLSIYYGSHSVFSGLHFTIEKGDRVALVGKNGAGKSSFLKLLLGESISYMGTLQVAANLKISYVSQDASQLEGSLKDYIEEEKIDETLFKAILRKLDFSRLQFEKNMKEYSQGQKKKVLIAKSLCQPAHLYVWDEPLNYIDVLSRLQIEKLIKEGKPTMIFVEHDKMFYDNVATKVIHLE